ncbi:hypothetical protein H0A70_20710 [Alcaligenaceae bacterium]|nr:hypothetical protein [Alcaligenaceae bacterium]
MCSLCSENTLKEKTKTTKYENMRGASQAEGFGLGLAIASTIAHGVGAELTLLSPAVSPSDGFEASAQFTFTTPLMQVEQA